MAQQPVSIGPFQDIVNVAWGGSKVFVMIRWADGVWYRNFSTTVTFPKGSTGEIVFKKSHPGDDEDRYFKCVIGLLVPPSTVTVDPKTKKETFNPAFAVSTVCTEMAGYEGDDFLAPTDLRLYTFSDHKVSPSEDLGWISPFKPADDWVLEMVFPIYGKNFDPIVKPIIPHVPINFVVKKRPYLIDYPSGVKVTGSVKNQMTEDMTIWQLWAADYSYIIYDYRKTSKGDFVDRPAGWTGKFTMSDEFGLHTGYAGIEGPPPLITGASDP